MIATLSVGGATSSTLTLGWAAGVPQTERTTDMYLVAMGWLYVAVMMSLAEAMHPSGTALGAMVTFLLYGLLPIGLVLYVMGTPLRRKARQATDAALEAEARAAGAAALKAQNAASIQPDASGHAPGAAELDGVAAVRKPD